MRRIIVAVALNTTALAVTAAPALAADPVISVSLGATSIACPSETLIAGPGVDPTQCSYDAVLVP